MAMNMAIGDFPAGLVALLTGGDETQNKSILQPPLEVILCN